MGVMPIIPIFAKTTFSNPSPLYALIVLELFKAKIGLQIHF